jgi:RNA polymerase sigma factor (sigma-70 family)
MHARVEPPKTDALTTYLDDAGSFGLLNAEEEYRRTHELVELRREGWSQALQASSWKRFGLAAATALGRDCPELPTRKPRTPAEIGAVVDSMIDADPDAVTLDRLDEELEDKKKARPYRAARARYVAKRNRFMCSNLRLVVNVAKRYGRRHMPLSDRIQEGNLGLVKAIHRFDPERGFRFSTYAAWWIRHAVTRALIKYGRTVRIPSHLHILFTRARRTHRKLEADLGRRPTDEELAEALGLPPEKVAVAMDAMKLRSVGFDDPADGEGGQSIAEVLQDDELFEWDSRVAERIDSKLADRMLDRLDDRAFEIVVRRFGLRGAERRTLRSLGEDYDLSRERIRQLQNAALRQLRDTIRQCGLRSIAVH